MAKLGAAEHEIDKATVKETKDLLKKVRKVARWIGMAAVASFRPGIGPPGSPKKLASPHTRGEGHPQSGEVGGGAGGGREPPGPRPGSLQLHQCLWSVKLARDGWARPPSD